MKGLRPILTVQDLMDYLSRCPADAQIRLMPEDGDGMQIGGILEFSAQEPKEVWILFDEFAEMGGPSMEWANGGGVEDEPEAGVERPGDMATAATCEEEKPDVVRVRGKLRTA